MKGRPSLQNLLYIVTNYSHKMSANMDITMAVHFDVPNIDYELPTSQNINQVICSTGKL